MTGPISADLPHLASHRYPSSALMLWVLRPIVRFGIRRYWRVRVLGQSNVPGRGPVILAANHVGIVDGPLLVAVTRRLCFAMAKTELFVGRQGTVLGWVGQISVDRRIPDKRAISRSIRLLRDGGVLAVFPEGRRTGGDLRSIRGGAVYLAMVTGAPIVPVALLGTRLSGQPTDGVPSRGAAVYVVYGEPMHVPKTPWPRTRAAVAEWSQVLQHHLSEHLALAQQRTGTALPGPPRRKQPSLVEAGR